VQLQEQQSGGDGSGSVTLNPNEIGIAVGTFPITTTVPATTTCAKSSRRPSAVQSDALLKGHQLFVG